MNRKAIIVAALAAASLFVAVTVAWILTDDGSPADEIESGTDETSAHHFSYGPAPWPADGSRTAVIELRPEGPFLQLTPENGLALAPQADGLELTWTRENGSKVTRLVGTGDWRGHKTTAVWTFAHGNPQAAFEIDVAGVRGEDLTEPFEGAWILPAGDVRHIDSEQRIVPWVGEPTTLNGFTPTFIEWTGSQQVLTISQGIYDSLALAPRDRGGVALNVNFAADATRPRLAECAPDAPVVVGGRFAFALGSGTPAVASRWSDGAQAVIAAVFEQPENHPDPLASAGHPMDGTDAARRVRTLALGHSDTTDPRHGNGGLLGVGLSATVALPDQLDEDASTALGESFKSTRLELADAESPVRLTGGDCVGVAEAIESGAPTIVSGYSSYDGAYHNSLNRDDLTVGSASTVLTLAQLDGRRASMTDQALGKLYIDRLLRERGGFFMSAPLVASRNPLIPAGKDGLLTPERNGHWTIAEELVYALADLELRTETEAFQMAGIGETVRHWRRMRQSEVWWTPDGLTLFHAGDEALEGATYLTAGTLDPTGSFLDGRDIRDARLAAQTWFWGTIPAGEAISVGLGAGFEAPQPVEWRFTQQPE